MSSSSSTTTTSAKRQAERRAREERKREFAEQQEREERARAEREEVLARIRALLDENNLFDPLTDDDRAALARHCRRVVAMPGERVMHWRPKRERQALRTRREAAEAERELERERRGMAPMRDEDHEFDPDAALYVVAEGAVDVVAYRDDDDDDDGEGDGVHGAFERAARDPPPPNAGEVAVTLRRGACFGELEKIFGASPNLRAAVVAVDPNDREDSNPRDVNPDLNPKPAAKPGAVLWAVDGRVLRRKKAFKAMVESMRAQVAAWRPLLDGVAFFADATDAMQRSFLACALRATTFRPREAVAKEGDECAGAWMVMEGEAHAMATLVGGDERWVAGYWPGDGFGFNSLVWGHGKESGDETEGGVERCLAFEATMRCGEDVDGTELAYVGRVTFARMFEKSTRSWRRMRATARESAARIAETRESKRPAPLRPGDPNIARMIAAMAAAATDGNGGGGGDGNGGGGGGGGDSPRPRTPRTPSPRRGRSPPPPPLVERQSADPTRRAMGRHMPDELLYPEEFETESEGEGDPGEGNGHPGGDGHPGDENALPGSENADPEAHGDETPRERRAGVAGGGGVVRSGERDARGGREEELKRRRRRDGKGGSVARDLNRPVRRREPLGPHPRGPTRLARLVTALESHPAFEGAERGVLSAAARDMESLVVPPGKPLYRHGAKGDYLYVVEAGTLDVMAPNPEGVGSPRTTGTVGPGGVVGDVALTFATTREHTTRAGPRGAKVWGMRRCWFERTAGLAVHGRRRLIRRFVHDVPILRGLPVHEQYACAEGFREAVFAPGDVVMRQGDAPDYFYILEEGAARCSVRLPGESEQFPVAQYGAGSYFGELEFLGDVRKGAGGEKKRSETVGGGDERRRRKATVTATTALRCAAIEGARFAELVAEGTELRRRMVREARTYVNSIH